MSPSLKKARFSTNPLELILFLVISILLGNSLYELIYLKKGIHPIGLTPLSANPTSENRSLAANPDTLITLDIPCNTPSMAQETLATKVRLNGTLCGVESLEDLDQNSLLNAKITNQLNQFTATIFTDRLNHKYSTDYIPLNNGKNPISLEFSYNNGKTFSQEVQLIKN